MEQGKSRTAGGDPAKGKAVPKTAEEYLTDGVVRTALECSRPATALRHTLAFAYVYLLPLQPAYHTMPAE